jgi:hypothetical protein
MDEKQSTIEAVPGQVWHGGGRSPRETVATVRKEMRGGALRVTEVEMQVDDRRRWTRLPGELPGMSLIQQPDVPETYKVEVIWRWRDEDLRRTQCLIAPGYTTDDDIPKMLAVRITGSPADAQYVHIVRTLRRIEA